MSGHTPGPWEWDGKFTVGIPYRDGHTYFRTNPIDAQLIHAAPDLAAALEQILRAVDASGLDPTPGDLFTAARAALTKAGIDHG